MRVAKRAHARASVVSAWCFFFFDRQARMSRRNPSVVEGRLALTKTAGEISRARVEPLSNGISNFPQPEGRWGEREEESHENATRSFSISLLCVHSSYSSPLLGGGIRLAKIEK